MRGWVVGGLILASIEMGGCGEALVKVQAEAIPYMATFSWGGFDSSVYTYEMFIDERKIVINPYTGICDKHGKCVYKADIPRLGLHRVRLFAIGGNGKSSGAAEVKFVVIPITRR